MNIVNRSFFFLLLVLVSGFVCRANIVYNILNYPADQNGAELSGSITTDGTLGILSESEVISWTFSVTPTVVSGGVPYTRSSTDANAFFDIFSGGSLALQATSTDLLLDGALRLGTDYGTTSQTLLEWKSDGATTLSISQLNNNASPSGWATLNPGSYGSGPWTIATVPDPSTLSLLGISTLLLWICNRRR